MCVFMKTMRVGTILCKSVAICTSYLQITLLLSTSYQIYSLHACASKMEHDDITVDSDRLYPLLLIPKKCTPLETQCDTSEDVFVNMNISSTDSEGNNVCIYSGFCNIKLIDSYNVNIKRGAAMNDSGDPMMDNQSLVTIAENPGAYNQSQVWIDPDCCPNIYNNNYNAKESQEHYSIHTRTKTRSITVEQHCTIITQNVYNYAESIRYTPIEADYDHKKFKKLLLNETQVQNNSLEDAYINMSDDEEYQCGVFLSQLPEEILHEKETKTREEKKFGELESQNNALKQLMSSDIQSTSKQTKTILYLGHDSNCGQTIQKISMDDPSLACSGDFALDDCEVVLEDKNQPTHKKYQCGKCKQIFDHLLTFKQHMVARHKTPKLSSSFSLDEESNFSTNDDDAKYLCPDCGKNLKSQSKFDLHYQRHGNPELECGTCRKVFASKFTLRTHRQIHMRKHPCQYCTKAYITQQELRMHAFKAHHLVDCTKCDVYFEKYEDYEAHLPCQIRATENSVDSSETDFAGSFIDDGVSEADLISATVDTENDLIQVLDDVDSKEIDIVGNAVENPDSVIAKVMSNKMFLNNCSESKRFKKAKKTCEVCSKEFERIGDLKRHLIEHVVRSTLYKSSVNGDGTLVFHCEVCQVATFTKLDKYKAHLREHAKLTLYKCTFCDKSFSDSSNFSKHKKIHGDSYFQCDLCQRKFNSKKMITRHMEYHNTNAPIPCEYCDKVFHFESMLNKHVKCVHTKQVFSRFKCRFCYKYFKSLKEKWDHEWAVHNVRKMVIDCLVCGSKFRKYAELKKHCLRNHDLDTQSVKNMLQGQ